MNNSLTGPSNFADGKIANCTKARGIDGIRYKYDIDYDDGDKDKGLPADVIYAVEDDTKKPEEPSPPDEEEEESSRSPVAPFEEGDKVEAQFRGRAKMKFYRKWIKYRYCGQALESP
jgi:hypothetical protein